MKKLNIGLNGFGRIGRAVTRIAQDKDFFDLKVINTSSSNPEQLAYMLKYDSVYRAFEPQVTSGENSITIGDKTIKTFNIRNPEEIPWADNEVDVVIDCTGVFTDKEGLSKHLQAGAKKVILTAPSKDEAVPHVVLGANDSNFNFSATEIMSNASCTTNCAAIMARVMNEAFGIESGFLTTTHSYTSTQSLVDNKHDKPTRGRAAAMSIIPTTTGAADAVCKVTDIVASQLGGVALRVPTPVGSITDMTLLLNKETTIEDIHAEFKRRSENDLRGILAYTKVPLVSADYIGSPFSCTYDANYTDVIGGKHVKLFGWYDNEWGYSSRIVDLVARLSEVM